jgi:catechol 2,3-dioxygenase-like lactoylglutathione lyase family enzyme
VEIFTNAGGTFAPVCAQSAPPERTCVYDLKRPDSRTLAFDYDHSGKLDHLVFYRPGAGTITILKNAGGTFSPVDVGHGIIGYDLVSPNDRAFAFDYNHSGKLDHRVLYRPSLAEPGSHISSVSLNAAWTRGAAAHRRAPVVSATRCASRAGSGELATIAHDTYGEIRPLQASVKFPVTPNSGEDHAHFSDPDRETIELCCGPSRGEPRSWHTLAPVCAQRARPVHRRQKHLRISIG